MTLPLTHRQQAQFAVEAALTAHTDFTDLKSLAISIIDGLEKNGFILTLAGAPRKLSWSEKQQLEAQILERRKR
jgi:hypothetical protein